MDHIADVRRCATTHASPAQKQNRLLENFEKKQEISTPSSRILSPLTLRWHSAIFVQAIPVRRQSLQKNIPVNLLTLVRGDPHIISSGFRRLETEEGEEKGGAKATVFVQLCTNASDRRGSVNYLA